MASLLLNIFYSWKFLLLTLAGMSAEFQLQPQYSMVLLDTEAHFNASVVGKWRIMTWTVNGLLVLTVDSETGPIPYWDRFSATNYSSGDTSRWQFNIHYVTRNDSGPILCTVQGPFGHRTAQLSVQERGVVDILGGNVTAIQDHQVEFQCVASAWFPQPVISWRQNADLVNASLYNTTTQAHGVWFNSTSVLRFSAVHSAMIECLATVPALASPVSSSTYLVVEKPASKPDWTVLIAVVVSIGGFALLVLLIIGIIFCYRRKKQRDSSYQDEMRRARTQSQINSISEAGHRQGQANLGYITDGQTSVTPSEFNDSGFSQTNVFEIPDVVNSTQVSNGNADLHFNPDGFVFKKHRHVTIV